MDVKNDDSDDSLDASNQRTQSKFVIWAFIAILVGVAIVTAVAFPMLRRDLKPHKQIDKKIVYDKW